MRINVFKLIIAIFFAVTPLYYSCQHNHNNHAHETKTDNHEGHDHGSNTEGESNHNHGMINQTIINNGYELYLEMPLMIVREKADFTIHITQLNNYKPIETNHIKVTLAGSKSYIAEGHGHEKGIYHASIQPKQTGYYKLLIEFTDLNKTHVLQSDSIKVYLNHDRLPELEEEEAGLTQFTKEQAWNEDFKIFEVRQQNFASIIKTSGEILPAPGDETIITALHSGTISLKNLLIEGKKVNKGDVIGIISSDLIHQNLTNDYLEAKNKFEKSKIDYNRAQSLVKEKLIPEKEYLEAKLDFESAKNAFNNIAKFYSDGNENVKASNKGFIRTVFVKEGQFIQEGEPIATIIQNKKIILKANIPQQFNHLAPSIFEANFSPAYTKVLFNTKQLNGKRLSYSNALPENSLFTSVNFELDASSNIMPGSYCSVYLKSAKTNNALIVPINSLMEDQGNYFVFKMVNGEHYKKTYITIGRSDGEFIDVTSGLKQGDYIVSEGTYKVYLASLGTAAPAHSHAH